MKRRRPAAPGQPEGAHPAQGAGLAAVDPASEALAADPYDEAALDLQLDTLRRRLLKIGGRVRELLTRVRLHLDTGHPGQPLWAILAARPGRR